MKRYGWIAALVVAADQLAKLGARQLSGTVVLIPGVVGLRYAENTGMAFSLLSGQPWLLGLLSAAAVAAGIAAVVRFRPCAFVTVSAMLIIGGAAGNMIDRLLLGYVVDMFEALFVDFAIFNVADAALTVGCALMIWSLLFRPEDWSGKKRGADEGNAD